MMSKSRMHNLSRCSLHFHKDSETVTFHPKSIVELDYTRFPKSNTKILVALEDFGRGSDGKAWFCATHTTPSSCCVLKFDNKNSAFSLRREKENWHFIYPEFSDMVKVEKWSGAAALVMPHFTEVPRSDRELYLETILETLTTKFWEKGKVHQDVKWGNIGLYRSTIGTIAAVVFDLRSVVDYNLDDHDDWIGKAMQRLRV